MKRAKQWRRFVIRTALTLGGYEYRFCKGYPKRGPKRRMK